MGTCGVQTTETERRQSICACVPKIQRQIFFTEGVDKLKEWMEKQDKTNPAIS
jgi:hypothetical protein